MKPDINDINYENTLEQHHIINVSFTATNLFFAISPAANMSEVVSAWDAEFVEVDQEMLFELILAANYMDIKPLLDLTCAKVASMIKGKTPEQISMYYYAVIMTNRYNLHSSVLTNCLHTNHRHSLLLTIFRNCAIFTKLTLFRKNIQHC